MNASRPTHLESNKLMRVEHIPQAQIHETTTLIKDGHMTEQLPKVPPSPVIPSFVPPLFPVVHNAVPGYHDGKANKDKRDTQGVPLDEPNGGVPYIHNVKHHPSAIGPLPEEIIPLPSSSSPLRSRVSKDMIVSKGV
jgi:hypothetical protein